MRSIKKDAVDQTVYFDVIDSSSAEASRRTGLVYNSAGLTAYYVRNRGSATAITLATLVNPDSAHSDGGFKEVDATYMPGIYRLDVPDAAFATGTDSVIVTIRGANNMVQVSTEIQLYDYVNKDIYDRIGAPAGATIAADIAAVNTVTSNTNTKAVELWKVHGLDSGNPMTVNTSVRSTGSITQNITGDGTTTSTVTRV